VDFAERAAVLASADRPDWASLVQHWRDGHVKLAWTRHLLKLRTELADIFTHGDYEPLEVFGPHRDHVIAFARRRGREAAIVVVAKSFAPVSQGGRTWPVAGNFDGAVDASGYSVQGAAGNGGQLRLSALFQHLPAAVLKARFKAAPKPARKRSHA
jgi:(1->4)-alpha-D-glucan 1-alpha-D-glucosylmutase